MAADMLDTSNMAPYLRAFLRYAKGSPRLWGLHNYQDVNRRAAGTRADAALVPGEVWLTETGGIVKFLPKFKRSSRAPARTKGMFKLVNRYDTRQRAGCARRSRGSSSTAGSARRAHARFDAGLVNADGTPRKPYSVFARYAKVPLTGKGPPRLRLRVVNLYSDTQTRPTAAMRRAMAEAEVGDEQSFADPTVLALCERVADLLGQEDAVFLPSGTMCNAIAFRLHMRPGGDEVVLHRTSHPIIAEAGGPAAISGAVLCPVDGPGGMFDASTLRRRCGRRVTATPALAAGLARADDEHRGWPRVAAGADGGGSGRGAGGGHARPSGRGAADERGGRLRRAGA